MREREIKKEWEKEETEREGEKREGRKRLSQSTKQENHIVSLLSEQANLPTPRTTDKCNRKFSPASGKKRSSNRLERRTGLGRKPAGLWKRNIKRCQGTYKEMYLENEMNKAEHNKPCRLKLIYKHTNSKIRWVLFSCSGTVSRFFHNRHLDDLEVFPDCSWRTGLDSIIDLLGRSHLYKD